MPQVIPFLASAAGAAGVITATTAAWLTIGTSIAVGLYERDKAKRTEAKARRAFNDSIQDRLITVRSAVSPRRYVLGTLRTGGTLVYADTVGTDKTSLDSVTALCCNETEPVGYYIGDEFLTPETFPGDKFGTVERQSMVDEFRLATTGSGSTQYTVSLSFIPAGTVDVFYRAGRADQRADIVSIVGTQLTFSGVGVSGPQTRITARYESNSGVKLRLQFKSGTPDQETDNWALVETPLWTAEHRLRGVSHMRTLMVWDQTIYASGAPPIGAVMRGRAIDGHPFYDPRDSSNPSTTDNPAILAGWWMTMPRNRGGCGIPSVWIDWPSIAAAANICDELITVRTLDGGAYEQIRRYRCNALLSTENAPLDNLQIILSAMAGRRAFTAGKYRIFAGAFRSATLTITDADIVGTKPILASASGGDAQPANIVTATFADATKNWQETTPKPVINDVYIDDDEHESPIDIRLQATTDPRLANYLMGVTLESTRPSFGVTLTVGGIGENIALYDTVQLSISNRPGLLGKTFEVMQIIDYWNGEFELTLAEIRPQTWALDPDRFTPSNPITPPDLSYLWNVPPITGLAVELGEPQILPDGNAITQIALTWDAVTALYIGAGGRIEIRYAEAGGQWIYVAPVPGDSAGTTITASLIEESNYVFQVKLVNSIGAAARSWSQVWVKVEGTELAVGVAGPGIFAWANPVGVSTTSSSITKSAVSSAWDAGAHSLQSYTGGCFVSARCGQLNTRRMIALNGDPAVDAGYLGLDYALHANLTNVLQVYESGLLISSHGAITEATLVAIKYDNSSVVYEKDGTPIRTVAAGANRRFFMDVSLFELGATLVDVAFGPMGGIGPQGLPGVAAQAVRLSATSQAFTFDGAGAASPAGQSITFTAVRQNIPTAAVWTAVANDGAPVTLTGSGDSRALSIANFGAKTWVRVRAESSGFFDEITVVRLTQGANGTNAIQAFLTNQNHTLAANPDGVVGSYANANGRLFVYEGTVDRTADATLSIQSQTGCTVQLNTATNTPIAGQPKGFYRVTAITADQAQAVLRAVLGSSTRDLPLTLTRAREGQPGDGSNLLHPEQWVVGTTGNQGAQWPTYGPTINSGIYLGGAGGGVPLGPFGTSDTLWECRRSDPSEANQHGGWRAPISLIDPTKSYRSVTWVRINEQTGNFYHDVTNSDGSYTAVTTVSGDGGVPDAPGRYNNASRPPENGKWFLSVAIVHGSGYTGGNGQLSGLYDPTTGRRVTSYSEYRWNTGVTGARQYALLWQATTTTRLYLTRPRFEEINGSEPTIDALLGFQRTIPWIETGNCYASTTSFFKIGGSSGWGADAIRSASLFRTCHLQFKAGQITGYFMVGLNSDPAADASYASLDYAWYCTLGGSLQAFESDLYVGEFGTYTADTDLALTMDGSQVRYIKDRATVRTIGAPAVPYGLDSAFYTPGAQANGVRFGPGIELETISTGDIAPGAVNEKETLFIAGPIVRSTVGPGTSGEISGTSYNYGVVDSSGMLVITVTLDGRHTNGHCSVNIAAAGHTGGAASGTRGAYFPANAGDDSSYVLRAFVPVRLGDNIRLFLVSKVTGIPLPPPTITGTTTINSLEYQVEFAKR